MIYTHTNSFTYCTTHIVICHLGNVESMRPPLLTGALPMDQFPRTKEAPNPPMVLFDGTEYCTGATKKRSFQQSIPGLKQERQPAKKKTKITNHTEVDHAKFTKKHLEAFAETLPESLKSELENNNGKPHVNKSFTADVVFRHVLPFILEYTCRSASEITQRFFKEIKWNRMLPTKMANTILTEKDLANLEIVMKTVKLYYKLRKKYATVDTSSARGYTTFTNFRNEKDFNEERVKLCSATLFQKGFNVENSIRYVGGPHTASH